MGRKHHFRYRDCLRGGDQNVKDGCYDYHHGCVHHNDNYYDHSFMIMVIVMTFIVIMMIIMIITMITTIVMIVIIMILATVSVHTTINLTRTEYAIRNIQCYIT